MNIKPTTRHTDIFFNFFRDNIDKIKAEPDMVEEMFAKYVNDKIQDPNLSDYEKGYIAGASFMGVLESFEKTVSILTKK